MRYKPWCSTHSTFVDPVYSRDSHGKMVRMANHYACSASLFEIHYLTYGGVDLLGDLPFPRALEREGAPAAP